jgi:hypothetical protein
MTDFVFLVGFGLEAAQEVCMSQGLLLFERVRRSCTRSKAHILKDHMIEGASNITMALGLKGYHELNPTPSFLAYQARTALHFNEDNFREPNAAWPWSTE